MKIVRRVRSRFGLPCREGSCIRSGQFGATRCVCPKPATQIVWDEDKIPDHLRMVALEAALEKARDDRDFYKGLLQQVIDTGGYWGTIDDVKKKLRERESGMEKAR